MATYCPCGCEKKLGITDRSIAKKAHVVEEKRVFLEAYALPMQRAANDDPEGLERFLADGEELRDELIGVIHSGDGRGVDRGKLNMWVKTATRVEVQTKSTLYQAAHKT